MGLPFVLRLIRDAGGEDSPLATRYGNTMLLLWMDRLLLIAKQGDPSCWCIDIVLLLVELLLVLWVGAWLKFAKSQSPTCRNPRYLRYLRYLRCSRSRPILNQLQQMRYRWKSLDEFFTTISLGGSIVPILAQHDPFPRQHYHCNLSQPTILPKLPT